MDAQSFSKMLEIIGTIAFASSGVMVGVEKKMDLFGIIVLAITTSVGGGIIRDVILGLKPPLAFRNPLYVEIATITAIVLFAIIYFKRKILQSTSKTGYIYEEIMFYFDAVGLGIFTVVGINGAIARGFRSSIFLMLFVGVITGVGGGLLRDMMSQNMPMIFVRHIYAVASLIGAYVCVIVTRQYDISVGMVLGAITVVAIRILARQYKWNLPRIK